MKLKDLWQEKYTVPMLKSMKTVAFETPSGQHSYNVVGANRRTNGDSTTTSIFCASGHQVKVTESSAMLLYPEALTGESEGVVERRLSQKVNWVANKSFEISKFKFKTSESSNLRTC